jgi:phenylacetate-CoA ligase
MVLRLGTRPEAWRNRMGNLATWPMKEIRLDANQMGRAEIAAFFDRWSGIRPVLLGGYVGAVLELARAAQQEGRTFEPPRAIVTGAAPISAGEKAFLSDVFRAPVYDNYQAVEVPLIAAECQHADGQHVFSDARWVEIVDDAGRPVPPGETGTLAVTDLRNRAFPLIRYLIGDRSSWKTEPCACGRPFPRLSPIAGRTTDILRLPSGLALSGDGASAMFNAYPDAVRQFQVCQHADASITLRCVRGDAPDADAMMQRVLKLLRTRVRGEVPVRLEVVDSIPHDRGKTRYVVREAADGSVAPPSLVPSDLVVDQRVGAGSTSNDSRVAQP